MKLIHWAQISFASIILLTFIALTDPYVLESKEPIDSDTTTLQYTNPIINEYLADPNVLYDNGYYYFFATGQARDSNYIPIYRSKNLFSWEFVRGAVKNGSKTDWNYKHFWAPEVIKIKGKYYLYYTASPEYSPANSGNRVGLAVAENIDGPYQNVGVVIPHGSIDGHPVFNTDGKLYIFFTIENRNENGYKAGQIYIDELISPEKVEGKPIPLITHHNWQEGPFIVKTKHKFLLTYSCGNWTDSTYHLRYAIADKLTGPYREMPDTIMQSNAMVKGPGHHSFFRGRKKNLWIIYHGWDTAFKARYPRLDRVFLDGERIRKIEPTFTAQPLQDNE